MAEKWLDHEASYKDIEIILKKYGLKANKEQIDKFLKHYKACQEMEEKLGHLAVKARSNGIVGDDLSAFKKDKGFYDAYKALDKEVDELWKVQQVARSYSNEAKQGVNDLKTLVDNIETDLKRHAKELAEAQDDLKKEQAKAKAGKGTISPSTVKLVETLEKEFKKREAALQKMVKQAAVDSKELAEAGGLYRKELDQKMESYAAKFTKTIEKLLDLAPKDASNEAGLPTALQARVLVVAVKKAVQQSKTIGKHLKSALEKAEKGLDQAQPDLKAAKLGLDQLKKAHKVLAANRKKYASAIKKAQDSKELYRQFRIADEAFADAEKALKETMKQIASMVKA